MPSPRSCSVLIVFLFLSLSSHPVHAEVWRNEVSEVQYGSLGSNVTLACGTSLNRTSVEWRLNRNAPLPWHQVTSEGLSLVLMEADQSSEGNYSCHDDQGLSLHTIRLQLGRAPGPLTVSCHLPNHSVVLCTWTEKLRTRLPDLVSAAITYRAMQGVQQLCEVDSSRQGCSISQPHFWQKHVWLNVTQTNALGAHSTLRELTFTKLLRPDPPTNLTVAAVEFYPRMLRVSWQPPSSWPPDDQIFPLRFQLRYRPLGAALWSSITLSDAPCCPLLVTDVLAGHGHQLQVRARDDVDGSWSEWSPLVEARPWTAPPAERHVEDIFPVDLDSADPDTSTSTSHGLGEEEDLGAGLVILLSLFAAVILTSVLSIVILMWVRQRRRHHMTSQKLTSLVKLKSMAI